MSALHLCKHIFRPKSDKVVILTFLHVDPAEHT